MRKQGIPKNNEDLLDKFETAVSEISLDAIQKGFIRSYSRDKSGAEDLSMIPQSLLGWYDEGLDFDENAADDLNIDSEEVHTDEES